MNFRHAVRALFLDWRFFLFVLAIMSAGIGLNTAMYTIVDASLLHPLPFANPERLARVFASNPGTDMGSSMTPTIAIRVARSRAWLGTLVTGNYFSTLGARAQHGRMFDVTARDPVTLLLVPIVLLHGPVRHATSIAPSQALRYE